MNPDRAIGAILAISLAVVLLLGIYLLTSSRRGASTEALPPSPTAAPPVAAASATATAGPPPAASGYRLAGTVVGDLAYAIIVDPQGNNQLYRPGQTVPGLGAVRSVEANQITLEGSGGLFTLQLAPGPTDTPTVVRTPILATRSPEAVTPARSLRARSGSESSP